MSDLTNDVALALTPVRKLAERLSAVERFAIERAVDDVLAICREEEEQADVTADLLNEAINEAEDK